MQIETKRIEKENNKKIKEIVKNMINKGVEIALIQDITGLNKKDIDELK